MRRDDLYWHLKECRWIYITVICSLLFVVLAVWGEYEGFEKKAQKMEEVREWPLVEATILEEKVAAVDSGNSNSPSVSYYVTLKVEFQFRDKLIRSKVRGNWSHRDFVKADKVFQVGNEIPLRVNPQKPEQASLIEITGNL